MQIFKLSLKCIPFFSIVLQCSETFIMPLADTIAASAVTINIRIKRGFSLDIGKYAAGSGNIQSHIFCKVFENDRFIAAGCVVSGHQTDSVWWIKPHTYVRQVDIICKGITVCIPHRIKFIVEKRCRIKVTDAFPGNGDCLWFRTSVQINIQCRWKFSNEVCFGWLIIIGHV